MIKKLLKTLLKLDYPTICKLVKKETRLHKLLGNVKHRKFIKMHLQDIFLSFDEMNSQID